jgi:hypothetical protein
VAGNKAGKEKLEKAGIEGECPAGAPRRGVYFLANESRTRVKIGKSTDIDHRIRDLGRMNADPVVLIAEVRGYTEVEKWMHRRFAAQRSHGEWFAVNDEIRAMVDSAIADRDVTQKLCAGAVKSDERVRPVYENDDDPLNPTDRDPVGDEDDILQRWVRAGGPVLRDPIDWDWERVSMCDRAGVWRAGAWIMNDRPYHCGNVGIPRSAGQIVELESARERQLAFIEAAIIDGTTEMLHGRFHWSLWKKLSKRRLDLGNVKHALPTEYRPCSKCSAWYNYSAASSGEWLDRLAHLTKMPGARLARIVNMPKDWY